MKSHVVSRPLLLVDGNNTAFRSAAVTNLTAPNGLNTSVSFGVLRSVRHALQKFSPSSCIVVWDGPRATFRVHLHPEYKMSSKRVKHRFTFDRDDIYRQITETKYLLSLLGIQQTAREKLEADDAITVLCSRTEGKKIILSSDKDFLQLIGPDIDVYNQAMDDVWTEDNFGEYKDYGFTPDMYLEFLILTGDKGDNIPGVPGVGEVTGKDLISRFKTVDGVLKWLRSKDRGKAKARESRITLHKDLLVRNRKLIDLRNFSRCIDGKVELLRYTPDYKKFVSVVGSRRFRFDSITKDSSYWLVPFEKLSARVVLHKG